MMHPPFDTDWLWLIPIVAQATEHLAATAHIAAQNAAMMSHQSTVRPPRYVPYIAMLERIGYYLYFIPVAISRAIRLTVNVSKTLTLKVFGSGQ